MYARRLRGILMPAAYLLLMAATTVVLADGAQATTAALSPGMKRCIALEKQLSGVVKAKKPNLPSGVRKLETQAHAFCSEGKTAQGARAYVKALNLLGVQPVLNKSNSNNE
jgi:hypothetical protein